jgi:hypothetical protein
MLREAEITSAVEVKQIYMTVSLDYRGASGPEGLEPKYYSEGKGKAIPLQAWTGL